MTSKLFSAVLLLTVATSFCQDGWYPWDGNETPVPKDDIPCDHPVCVEPCPEAGPPSYCPTNMTQCSSGCVCMLQCKYPAYVCFQTKFCISRRRYLKRLSSHPTF